MNISDYGTKIHKNLLLFSVFSSFFIFTETHSRRLPKAVVCHCPAAFRSPGKWCRRRPYVNILHIHDSLPDTGRAYYPSSTGGTGTAVPGFGNRRTRLWEQENQALGMEVPGLGNGRLDRLVFPTSAPGSGLKSRSRTDIVIFWLRSRNPGKPAGTVRIGGTPALEALNNINIRFVPSKKYYGKGHM